MVKNVYHSEKLVVEHTISVHKIVRCIHFSFIKEERLQESMLSTTPVHDNVVVAYRR
jgi:hypothetical protein